MRINLTAKEAGLIRRMCAIASAKSWGEGDYSDWTAADTKPFTSLRLKAAVVVQTAIEGNLTKEARKSTR